MKLFSYFDFYHVKKIIQQEQALVSKEVKILH